MEFYLFGELIVLPTDVVAAWVSVILGTPIVLYWLTKKRHWPVIWDYATSTNHRKIGTLYIIFAILFFFRAGIDALFIRLQLVTPENQFWVFQGDKYNEIFTTHGTMMIFFVAMPLLIGLMNVAVPLQIGANDLAFPFLNAIGFYLFLTGGMIFFAAFFFNAAPNAGWTAYAPLSTYEFTGGPNNNYYIFGLQISGLGTIFAAINMIVTILRLRAPGLKLTRMPLFPWASLITSFLILVAFPVLAIALLLLQFDRLYGATFFVGELGHPVYWQHLFWIFGHPEVYILALPAFGIFSDIISAFSRKNVFGYTSMVIALALIGMLGFMVWAHHMFTVGLGPFANTFFAITTMMIAVPTGVKVFNWLFTMRRGVIRIKTPMLFALGFIPTFVMGGVTGVMLASAAADMQYHDTYFVVAHFHYVIIGSTVLGAFAGLYYWYPKMTGKMLDEKLGKWHFWLFLIGFHLTFFPQHLAGLNGMPRRVYDYTWEDGVFVYNFISTIGAFMMGASMLFVIWNVYKTHRPKKENVGADPWDGRTLEWYVPSPAPEHPFEKMPIIDRRDALWWAKQEGKPLPVAEHHRASPVSIRTVQPFVLSVALTIMSFGFIYGWLWMQIIGGAASLGFFVLRAFNDERTAVYRKEEQDNEQ
ncbi:cytochrome c oxidase subunit 1/cytochrome aa3-600 menaquinol oxidase subunit 1 [Thalassobacillus cyri]|uniref:Cytochrome c oxidase subunit 1 n=1 Tax=Thalassobacillus cyri TaxID=571932 RepID=A0A1H4DHN0_9BACI|nr:cytochrome c oxidase subunit I [Thalassobacillus cyri]SEA71752.1 cytochrome c oxidase subunit 1/cytochrome aa3-600 menaquinol oxidase subunit 1 [Thalassobacillus cyri]